MKRYKVKKEETLYHHELLDSAGMLLMYFEKAFDGSYATYLPLETRRTIKEAEAMLLELYAELGRYGYEE